MPCTIFYPRPMTRREQARAWMDGGGKYPFSRTDDAFLDQVVGGRDPNDGPIFACGSEEVPVCRCGHMADILCDWPVGRGKTCDLPLCPDCAHHIGDDRDLVKYGLTPETLQGRSRCVWAFLVEHEGHEFDWWSSDYAFIDDKGDLRGDYDNDLILEGVGGYEKLYGRRDGSFTSESPGALD